MKKALTWVVLAVLMFSMAIAPASGEQLVSISAANAAFDSIGIQGGTELTVGSITQMTGHFGSELWGNNSADLDVRALLHGYGTVAWTESDGLKLNGTAITGVDVTIAEDGSRTYTLTLREGLTYNDGMPLTARDYVFSLLLSCAPQITEIGGIARGLQHLVGYEPYLAGESKAFAGVRLISPQSFSLEIDGDYLPYFYGLAMLDVTPYPMDIIAPGCEIADDGEGAYIAGPFTAALLERTMLDPDTGYLHHPQVTSGPYSLESYDAATGTATFRVNALFRGNYEGQKPHIERIIFRPMTYDTLMDELESGALDLANKVASGSVIAQWLRQSNAEETDIVSTSYPRSGLAFLSFACEQGVTADVAVRRAIAHCVNKTALVNAISPYSVPVEGYYGVGQWMVNYVAETDEAAGLQAIDMAEEREKLALPYDLVQAKVLLAQAGWTLNAQGEPFNEGTDAIRYRKQGDALEPLVIRWAKTQSNTAADQVQACIEPAFAEVGIGLEITEMPFAQVLAHYYRQVDRGYDMFFVANNFLQAFDPYYDFNTADVYQGMVNTTGLKDERLMELAYDMRRTNPADGHGYALKWLAFQQRWVEQMPMVPLYSNMYFDLYSQSLRAYDIRQATSWGEAILYAWLDELAGEIVLDQMW